MDPTRTTAFPTTDEAWRSLLAREIRVARRMIEARGEIGPLFVIDTPTTNIVINGDFPDEAAQDVFRFIRLTTIAWNAVGIRYIAMVTINKFAARPDETNAELETRSRSGDPERTMEAVVVIQTYRNADNERITIADMREVILDADGRPTGLLDEPLPSHSAIETNLEGLLPPFRPTESQREAARRKLETLGVPTAEMTQPTVH